jgi:uncharacterized protein YacL
VLQRRRAPGEEWTEVAVAPARSAQIVTELVRLAVVLSLVAVGFTIGAWVDGQLGLEAPETTRLVTSVLGALVGYLAGGGLGRGLVRSADQAGERLAQVPAVQLVSASLGIALGGFAGLALLLPVLLLPYQQVTVPVTVVVLIVLAYAGGRLGASRGAELARFVGVRGRLEVRTPSRGSGVRVVDSSALIDGRIADISRAGFLNGTVVVPRFVIAEVQRIADAGPDHRSALGRRGLSTLAALQDDGVLSVEIDDDEVPGVAEVDAKLVALCRERRADLVTTDAPLARTAELGGIRVLNPHALADAVRSPVLPGDRVELLVVREGRERDQGIGYLQDGTMVVVEGGTDVVGDRVEVDVTSIVQSRTGRLLFASRPGREAQE